jgi:hypothetical protein
MPTGRRWIGYWRPYAERKRALADVRAFMARRSRAWPAAHEQIPRLPI